MIFKYLLLCYIEWDNFLLSEFTEIFSGPFFERKSPELKSSFRIAWYFVNGVNGAIEKIYFIPPHNTRKPKASSVFRAYKIKSCLGMA